MKYNKNNQPDTENVNRAIKIYRRLTFADYHRVARLQQAIIRHLSPESAIQIEAEINKRKAEINIWLGAVPLVVGFIPLWLTWMIPLLRESFSPLQFMSILGTLVITGACYLVTFYNDLICFKNNLASAGNNIRRLLRQEQREETLPVIPKVMTIPTPKGSIPLLLLNELVKKETGHSNIYDTDPDAVIPYYQKLIGFNEKNFRKIMQQYRRRQNIRLDQENARTTHIGYLDTLIRYYQATKQQDLEQQAMSLQTFLNTTQVQFQSKKLIKMHL